MNRILAAVAVIWAVTGWCDDLIRRDFAFDGVSGFLGWEAVNAVDGRATVDILVDRAPSNMPAVRVTGSACRVDFAATKLKLVAGETYRLAVRVRSRGLEDASAIFSVYGGTDPKKGLVLPLPGDTAGEWRTVEAVGVLPKATKGQYTPIFQFFRLAETGYCDLADPVVEPLSDKGRQGSSLAFQLPPIVGRIVPVDPLLSEVDPDTGLIRFMYNGDTNGCEIVATVNGRPLGPIPEGRHVVDVKLVEKATGKVRRHNTYPFIAKRRRDWPETGRRLNNFVTEVVSTNLVDGSVTFVNPREGWVFIGFDRPYEGTKAYLDAGVVPAILFRPDEPSETMRYLEAGEHRLTIVGATGGTLSVCLVKTLVFGGECVTSPVSDFRKGRKGLGWDFLRKSVLPSCNVFEWDRKFTSEKNGPDVRKELMTRGKVCTPVTGLGPTLFAQRIDAKAVRGELIESRAFKAGYPLMFDENGVRQSFRELNLVGEGVWELSNTMDPRPFYSWYFGMFGPLPVDSRAIVTLMAANVNCGCGKGMILHESYLRAYADIAKLDEEIDTILSHQQAIGRIMPEASRRIVHGLCGHQLPGHWTSQLSPAVDPKIVFDRYVHRLATDPAFADVGGVGMSNLYCDEEIARWGAEVVRHYAILGRTDSLAEARGWKYQPGTVADGDFDHGLKMWQSVEAEPGSVVPGFEKGYGKDVQGRNGADGAQGSRFAVLTRSAKGPNCLSQMIGGLKPGDLYSLSFVATDLDVLKSPLLDNYPKMNLSVELSGCSLLPEYAFSESTPSFGRVRYEVMSRGKKARCPVTRYRYVFRAEDEKAKLTIMDWESTDRPGGRIGQRTIVNYVAVNPYFAPKGNELCE